MGSWAPDLGFETRIKEDTFFVFDAQTAHASSQNNMREYIIADVLPRKGRTNSAGSKSTRELYIFH